MLFHRNVVLVATGAALGLCAGILLQKFFPVGRAILKIKQAVGIHGQPNVSQASLPVSPPAEARIRTLAGRMAVDPITGAIKLRHDKLREDFESKLPEEEAFRNSEAVTGILNHLRTARNEKSVAEIEYRFDRVFRESNLLTFEEPAADGQNRILFADRIAEFSKLLAQEGTHLIYCPSPSLIDCFLSQFTGAPEYRSARPEHTRFLMALIERGVDVIDLRPEFGEMTLAGRIPFHRFDHHWTPAGIELAAEILHREIETRFDFTSPFGEPGAPEVSYRWISIPASQWYVDLAPPETDPGTLFCREVLLGDAPMMSVPNSPIWVMGDSILMELSPIRTGISADLGSHLSGRLNAPVNSLGRPGTTDIRQAFFLNSTLAASRPKLLIWIHSEENNSFPMIQAEAITSATDSISGTARILEISPLPNPKTTPYPDAIFSFRAELQLPREQTMTVIVYAWAFRDRVSSPLSAIKTDDERKVKLLPIVNAFRDDESLRKARLIDQLDNSEGDPVFWLDGTVAQ